MMKSCVVSVLAVLALSTASSAQEKGELGFVLGGVSTGVGAAQPDPLPARPAFTFGAALGVAAVSLSSVPGLAAQTDGDVALAWRVGFRISSRTALVVNGASSVYTHQGTGRARKRGFEGVFPSVLFQATPQLWVSGGVGLNLDAPAFYDIHGAGERSFYRGVGALALVGYELHRTRHVGLEVLARVHAGFSDVPEGRRHGRSASLLLGISR